MKYSTAIAVIAAAGAYADLETVKGVLSDVSSSIDSLNTAANGFNGNVDAVKSKADDLVSTIKKGKTTVDGSSNLELADAVGLTSPVQALTKKGKSLADNFKAKRSEVEKAGACGTVREELKDINDNSQALIKSVVSKVPKDAQSIAEGLAKGLTDVLAQAQDDFSESNCKNSGGSSQTGGSSKTSAVASETSAVATETGSATIPATTLAPTATGVVPTHPNNGTTGVPPPVTAGASFLAPAGALVMAIAAALV